MERSEMLTKCPCYLLHNKWTYGTKMEKGVDEPYGLVWVWFMDVVVALTVDVVFVIVTVRFATVTVTVRLTVTLATV